MAGVAENRSTRQRRQRPWQCFVNTAAALPAASCCRRARQQSRGISKTGIPRIPTRGGRARDAATVAPSTCISCRRFGTLRLERLTPHAVQRWLTQHKAEHGARRRITIAHAVLRSALSDARRLQLVGINAAELVKVPQPKTRAIAPLDVDQAARFLRVAGEHRLSALFSVALACGLRLGEATGLKWDDVDLEAGEVRVRQQLQPVGKSLMLADLKTENSRRTLVLPAVCIDALKAHRKRQPAERLKAGPRWVDTGLVFTTYRTCKEGKGERFKVGAGLHPRNVLRTLHGLLEGASLPKARFHDLRHSAASLLIANGVELVEVSKLLGHSEIRVTADLYSHLQKQTAARAARVMDSVLGRTP
jgi:integrase